MNPYPPPVPPYAGYPMGAAPPPGYPPYHQPPSSQSYQQSHSPYSQPPPGHSPGGRAADHSPGLYAPGSHHKATLSPSASANNLTSTSPGPDSQADRAAQVLAKTRSVMACVLCRKQKVSLIPPRAGFGFGRRPSLGGAGSAGSQVDSEPKY